MAAIILSGFGRVIGIFIGYAILAEPLRKIRDVRISKPYSQLPISQSRSSSKTTRFKIYFETSAVSDKKVEMLTGNLSNYSRTSVARTLMSRLPRLLESLGKNPIAAEIIIFGII